MPSRHAPIKKYNYERSLFRWVMSRHPEPFEEHGITTRTLERTPLAREAFYTSGWPGARALVQSSDESKYERTAFFDAIIERGLRGGTRFNIDHVTAEEKSKLGITVDRASGKFYLAAYGSPKARRSSTRRGSQTSSDGDGTEHNHHAVVKEVEEMLTAEIAAAGEHAEVILLKARTDPGSSRGSKTINFSVSIRRRSSGECGESGRERGEGHGAGPLPLAHTQAADAGGGKAANAPRSRVTKASQPGDAGPRVSRDGSSPKQAQRGDSSGSGNTALGRSVPAVGGGGLGETRKGADEFSMQEAASKRRRSTTDAIFANAPRLAANMTPKHEPRPSMSGPNAKMDMRFGRPGMATDANRGRVNKIVRVDVPMSFLPGRVASMSQATMPQTHQLSSATMGGQYGAGGTSSARGQTFSATGGGNFSGLNECYQQQRPDMATGTGQMLPTAGTGEGGGGGVPVASMSTTSAIPAWQLHATASMRTDDLGAQLVARTTTATAGRGGGETIGVEVGNNTGGTTGFGSMSTLSQQQQQHLSGATTTFGQRMPTAGMGRASPTTLLVPDSQSTISGLNAYSAHVRQQAHATPSGNHGTWGANTRMGTSLSCGREPDEEDMDFLASFF